MARLFDDGNSEYLLRTSAVLTAVPISMGCWFNANDVSADQTMMGLSNNTGGRWDGFWLVLQDPLYGNKVSALTLGVGGLKAAYTSTGASINTWHHCLAIYAAANSRSVYIDGGSKGTNADATTPDGINNTTIGSLLYNGGSTDGYEFSGMIAEAALWNIALTDADALILAKGYSPLFVKPANLVAYWPLIR